MRKINYKKGEIGFGAIILIFLAIMFIIWVFVGGPEKPESKKPFITPYNNSSAPLQVYGPNEKPN